MKELTVRGTFTDETDAVSAVEIIPAGVVDEASTVLAVFMAVGPVIRLAGPPHPKSMNNMKPHTRCFLIKLKEACYFGIKLKS